ncbi:MAG: extracellular solute-binding protein [Eubacteriales bacterium]|nr:extracellular solute-binding protein [Eubacteriales bacterium]
MKKRMLSMTLALAMGALLLAGCGGTAKKEDVSIIIKTPALSMPTLADESSTTSKEFLDKAVAAFTEQYEKANVTIELVEFQQEDEAEAVPGTFGTDRAPDVVYMDYFNMNTYIHSGYVVPLDDIITDEMKADIDDVWWDNSQLNGKTYMMPFLGRENILAYNKQMFIDAGLEKYISDDGKVQNWTLDEWEEILAALRASLPETSAPMMMYAGNNQGDTHIMTLLRMYGCEFFDANGHINMESAEGIKALETLRAWNEAGYFPKNADLLVSNDVYNLFMDGQLAIVFNNAALDETMCASYDIGYVNFPSVNGKGLNTTFVTGFEVYDNGDAAKLAVAKDFVKFIYESDFVDYESGAIPANNSVAEKYADGLAFIQKYIDVSDCGVNFTGNQPNWRGVRAVFYPHIQDLIYGDKDIETIAQELDADCNAAIDEGYAESTLHE